jgi:hypothetical protein
MTFESGMTEGSKIIMRDFIAFARRKSDRNRCHRVEEPEEA